MIEYYLLALCFGNFLGLGLKDGSDATRENHASVALLLGDIYLIVGSAEFSLLAMTLRYWL